MPAEGFAINRYQPSAIVDGFLLWRKMSNSKAFIFANGEFEKPANFQSLIQQGDCLVAVDGGIKHLLKMNLIPDLTVGDFDSMTSEEMRFIENHKVRKVQLERKKNETDLEIAIQTSALMGHTDITLLGVLGRRLDHTLENIFILMKPEWKKINFKILDGNQEIFLIRNEKNFYTTTGDIVSLIPLSTKVTGVKTEGLMYKLLDENLYRKNARGISNIAISKQVSIKINSGILLCFHIFKDKK
jgi:thiamine pyrophosphokinase